ncbi:DUF1127 domain-containing protein [Roseobacter sp. N2S]|uniref:DUF1127 domain-containing protein n=1 Tax=Roseobacter sp. N2S TaxID=2663844 RepID=UPI002861A266|nr:DUF1127 domain-containing protein [Roseobacter sp. N2S]MDR6264000.1 uncharacterized protein YjiS (DUF1127 family) [Roseobacter sp. N2S]
MTFIDTQASRALKAALRPPDFKRLRPAFAGAAPFVWMLSAVTKASARARNLHTLRQLPDHLLRDIGLEDSDIAQLKPTEFNSDSNDPQIQRLR